MGAGSSKKHHSGVSETRNTRKQENNNHASKNELVKETSLVGKEFGDRVPSSHSGPLRVLPTSEKYMFRRVRSVSPPNSPDIDYRSPGSELHTQCNKLGIASGNSKHREKGAPALPSISQLAVDNGPLQCPHSGKSLQPKSSPLGKAMGKVTGKCPFLHGSVYADPYPGYVHGRNPAICPSGCTPSLNVSDGETVTETLLREALEFQVINITLCVPITMKLEWQQR